MPTKRVRPTTDRYLWQIRVELLDIVPHVWRRLIIPYDITLPNLHRVLQAAFAWDDCHLHQFTFHGVNYAVPDPDPDPFVRHPPKDERRVVLHKVATPAVRAFDYLYDFGDHWHHLAIIESHRPQRSDALHVLRCVDGANAAPPEDVGGLSGYARFLEAIADRDHPEHASLLEWVGGTFEPSSFSIAEINRALAKLNA